MTCVFLSYMKHCDIQVSSLSKHYRCINLGDLPVGHTCMNRRTHYNMARTLYLVLGLATLFCVTESYPVTNEDTDDLETTYTSVETNISSSSDKHGKLNVTCLAKALPPASNVTWIGLSNIDNSTSITNNTDGTLTVRSTLHIADEKRQVNGSAYCRVSHQVSVTYLAAPWNSEDDMGIFGLIMEELDLSDSYELVFNDGDDGGEDDEYDDDDEGEDYEEDK
uniref:Glycoprotein vOX2-3 n=2 Tax=Elephant endotheliotropic herpesvirus 1A TaxID=759753 RepID=A0A1L3HP07_ELHV1|nr:glycoprotein vOX2-3 [Elephant endotheliotropic herpesvirus 1A]APG41572.2 glycoprotein vOX2-3 [Elephant endotheliotropic herpesvirus 1A]AYC62716.1 glycoprotein vOX2-3 [Elephant endotheliotropic herpesvirus 1A]AYC62783.1 glycoprotein vOX2-3 [Elephant endotheliotropic herpesvirus 1A]